MVSYEHHDVSPIDNPMRELELKGRKLLVLVKAHIIKYKSTDSQAERQGECPGKTFQIFLLFFLFFSVDLVLSFNCAILRKVKILVSHVRANSQ